VFRRFLHVLSLCIAACALLLSVPARAGQRPLGKSVQPAAPALSVFSFEENRIKGEKDEHAKYMYRALRVAPRVCLGKVPALSTEAVGPREREDYGFTGKEQDVEVGLTYFGKRYLVPGTGRWLSPDPLAVHVPGKADLNLYAYVHGRVFTSVDPWGLTEADAVGLKSEGPVPSSEHNLGQNLVTRTDAVGAFVQDDKKLASLQWSLGASAVIAAVSVAVPWVGVLAVGSQVSNHDEMGKFFFAIPSLRAMAASTPATVPKQGGEPPPAGGGAAQPGTTGAGPGATKVEPAAVAQAAAKTEAAAPNGATTPSQSTFPTDPAKLMPDAKHVVKPNGNRTIYPSDSLRIRAESHPLEPGETFSPRHHGQHYHVEVRKDPKVSWNNKSNVDKVKPEGYKPGEGTGFVPGEQLPGDTPKQTSE
jgi:RHS repeat-associated protein